MTPAILEVEIGSADLIAIVGDRIVISPDRRVTYIHDPDQPGFSLQPRSEHGTRTVFVSLHEIWTEDDRAVAVGKSLAIWTGIPSR